MRTVAECRAVLLEKSRDDRLVPVEIVQSAGMIECEAEGFERAVEAQEPDRAGAFARGTQHGERVGGGAQSHVPDDELAVVPPHPCREVELPDVECFRFRHGADDRVKGLAVCQRVDTADAVRQPHEAIAGFRGCIHVRRFSRFQRVAAAMAANSRPGVSARWHPGIRGDGWR